VQISLIVNTSDNGELEQLRTEVARLRAAGHEVVPQVTFEAGDAGRMAAEAARRGVELVIVAGGDGTIHEIVNGLHGLLPATADEAAGARLPRVGIVPLGTGNDLASALELPTAIPAAVRVAVDGLPIEVDVGMVEERCFLNVSTGGFGAEAAEEAGAEIKRALGPLAYVITGARKFASLEVSSARFADGDVFYEGPFLIFAVGNSRRTGGGNWLTPRAELSDGLLDLCVVKEMSRMEFLALLPELRAGTHLSHPAVLYRQVPSVTVESAEELSVNADGEPIHGRRFQYRLSPHRLTLMMGERRSGRGEQVNR
jgi:lipid kinase YegS